MAIWSAEVKELEKLSKTLNDNLPMIGKELEPLIKTNDANVVLLYARRCLEVMLTELCETELKRPRKTEPLKGIIDKLNSEDKVPSNIIASMHGLNSLATFGTHPKDFEPEQVKPVLNNLLIVTRWYLKFKGIEVSLLSTTENALITKAKAESEKPDTSQIEKSIAILPFRNDSPDEENAYFINGVMEEILNNLQKIRVLRVISRTSVEQYRNQTKPIPEIARELGVNYILEGSAQRYGNNFRLRTQLILADKETHLWGESFQKQINETEDIFGIQNQIAESIATELKVIITPEEKKRIETIPTSDMAAYEAYLKGKFYAYKSTVDDLEIAMHHFELAKERDPEFALPFAGIAMVWMIRQQLGMASPEEAGPKIMEAVGRAHELDNTLAEIHFISAAMNVLGMWDWEAGEAAYKKAIEINPNHTDAHAIYSQLLIILGRPEEGMEHANLAFKLDPHNPMVKVWYSADLLFVHRYDDCITISRELLEKNPTMFLALANLFPALHMKERYDEAFEATKLYICNFYTDFDHVFDQYEHLGYAGTLNLEADVLLAQSESKYIVPLDIALLYIHAGNKERALECLEKSYEMHDSNAIYLGVYPEFSIIHNEPRYKDLLKKLNLPDNN
jgi:TolB-like protein